MRSAHAPRRGRPARLTLALAPASPPWPRRLRLRHRQRQRQRRRRLRSQQMEGAARGTLGKDHRRHCRRGWQWHRHGRQRQRGRRGGPPAQRGRQQRRVARGEQPLGRLHHAHQLLHVPRVLQQLLWVAKQVAQLGGLLRAASKLEEEAACAGAGGGGEAPRSRLARQKQGAQMAQERSAARLCRVTAFTGSAQGQTGLGSHHVREATVSSSTHRAAAGPAASPAPQQAAGWPPQHRRQR